MPELKTFTRDEVAKHSSPEDCWIIIDSEVYDVTSFADMHPGGTELLLEYGGKDVTDDFYGLHRQEVLIKYAPKLKIGSIANEAPVVALSGHEAISQVPYAEPNFWMGFRSPYYTEGHKAFRSAVRKVFAEIKADALMCEELGKAPTIEMYQKIGVEGIIASRIGPGPWLQGLKLPGGVKPEEFDHFHELIVHEETARMGTPSFADGLTGGFTIGLPPIINFGRPALKERIVPEVLLGNKRICLAITEPYTGSDVSSIRTTAKLTPDGKYYIVNGAKKWITNGTFADYFSTAVRTEKGISMLLIERSEGLETKLIKTSYGGAAGTAYVTFENVKVPAENLLGKDGQGFQVIMYNFNHERWFLIAAITASTRCVIEECFKWAHQRKVFGKRLIDQPVIRNKLGNMVSQVEAVHNWLENTTYQMSHMSYEEQSKKLAGPIALLKFRATRVAHEVADDACQIFGGRGITKTGMGRVIENFHRTYKFAAIPGGSEEIMADLGIKQAMKYFPASARL